MNYGSMVRKALCLPSPTTLSVARCAITPALLVLLLLTSTGPALAVTSAVVPIELVEVDAPRATTIRRALQLGRHGLTWMRGFARIAPYVAPIIETIDEIKRIAQDAHRAAELSKHLEALKARIDVLERQLETVHANDAEFAKLKAILKQFADELKTLQERS